MLSALYILSLWETSNYPNWRRSFLARQSQTSHCKDSLSSQARFLSCNNNGTIHVVLLSWELELKSSQSQTITCWCPEIDYSESEVLRESAHTGSHSLIQCLRSCQSYVMDLRGLTCIKEDRSNWSLGYVRRHSWDILQTALWKTLVYKHNNIVQALFPLVSFLGPIKWLDNNRATTTLH